MSPRYLFRRPPLAYRIFKGLMFAALLFLIATVTGTFLLRFIPPITSGVMIERFIEAHMSLPSSGKTRAKKISYRKSYQWKQLHKIAPIMGVAVVTSEDQEFAEHFGFDWGAIVKAIEYNQKHRRTRGASTISQQTAKNLFLWTGRSWVRKGLEVYFTVLIETLWSKERILEVYLNIIEFGDGIYGVEAAAQHFFNKSAAQLNSNEAALLAAVLPNPHIYKAGNPSPYVLGRQQWILNNMHRVGGTEYIKNL
jgi:monofunctional biosynthetic peptidoglycan transglycosylase